MAASCVRNWAHGDWETVVVRGGGGLTAMALAKYGHLKNIVVVEPNWVCRKMLRELCRDNGIPDDRVQIVHCISDVNPSLSPVLSPGKKPPPVVEYRPLPPLEMVVLEGFEPDGFFGMGIFGDLAQLAERFDIKLCVPHRLKIMAELSYTGFDEDNDVKVDEAFSLRYKATECLVPRYASWHETAVKPKIRNECGT
jgi:hypothetical protein